MSSAKQISSFLGRPRTENELMRIVEHCNIHNMKQNPATNWIHKEKLKEKDPTFGSFINTGRLFSFGIYMNLRHQDTLLMDENDYWPRDINELNCCQHWKKVPGKTSWSCLSLQCGCFHNYFWCFCHWQATNRLSKSLTYLLQTFHFLS